VGTDHNQTHKKIKNDRIEVVTIKKTYEIKFSGVITIDDLEPEKPPGQFGRRSKAWREKQ